MDKSAKLIIKCVCSSIIAIILLILIFGSFYNVDTGQVAIIK